MQPTTSTKKGSRYKKTPPVRWHLPEKDRVVELLNAIFTAERRGKTNRETITDEHRVLWQLCLFGAARPESEPCRLKQDDVTFIEHGWATISYEDTKNEQSLRTIPIPPPVAAALKAIMIEDPEPGTEAHGIWAKTPIFRKGGRSLNPGSQWDNKSYKEAWTATKAALAESFPEILTGAKIVTSKGEKKQPKDMVLRDLRGIARTLLRKAGIAREVYRRYLGHVAKDTDDGYDEVSLDDLRKASEALTALV